MLNEKKLDAILDKYIDHFGTEDWNEIIKWQAIKQFQVNWDIDAPDFAEMLKLAFSKTKSLLSSQHFLPRRVVKDFAAADPERTREMFRFLYDESIELNERVDRFMTESEQLRLIVAPNKLKNHFQTMNAISTYLWLKYPDKYYIYKYTELRNASKVLEGDFIPRKDMNAKGLFDAFSFFDEICVFLSKRESLIDKINSFVDREDCYPDPAHKTMTIDLVRYIAQKWDESVFEDEDAENQDDHIEVHDNVTAYYMEDFLDEVYIDEADAQTLISMLKRKKNIILQGAPGVGKTFAATRLAYTMMGVKDLRRISFIQFHQNYSYEDMVMGYKPDGDGFALQKGIFYRACEEARLNPQDTHFFIIDEINRGNMSKIFGELLMLIESDYRGIEIILPYSVAKFSVPSNLYIIGMMNTADRSLAMIDYALRRRFSFFTMKPAFQSRGFQSYQNGLGSDRFNKVIEKIESLNNVITQDNSLGEAFSIGHSYFCNMDECSDDDIKDVVCYEVLPMLEEYWFDNQQAVEEWRTNLLGVFL